MITTLSFTDGEKQAEIDKKSNKYWGNLEALKRTERKPDVMTPDLN